MAMVNMNNLLNGKDSRWLQLEVCREFQRNKCSRPDTECKFAHPPANVEVQNGRVTACYDSIKGRCNREKPPCKYFHPPQHLKDQLLINGRNHLALKNALMQQMGLSPGQPLVPGQVQAVAASPYLTGMPQVGSTYSPYFAPGPIMPTIMGPDPTGVGSPLSVVPQTVVTQQKMPRSDRLEMDMKSVGSFYYENFAFPGMMPYKRPAADKSGVPVYQPNANTYQQLMQLQQPFVPVSCEYPVSPAAPLPSSVVTSCASPAIAAAPSHHQQQDSQITNNNNNNTAMVVAAGSNAKESSADLVSTAVSSSSAITTTAAANSAVLPSYSHSTAMPIVDPATLAKEVAQQNYAKAIKLAAVNQSLAAANPAFSQLNPLNYTGVALNKHTLTGVQHHQGLTRYPSTAAGLPFGFGTHPAGLNFGFANNPYSAAAMAHQQNLFNFGRPQAGTVINPYSLIRSPYPGTAGAATTSPLFSNSLLGAQYPVTVSASPLTNVSATASMAVAAAQNNNSNVVIQPYKKLKTT